MRESILSVLPGDDEHTRVVVIHRQCAVGRSEVLLRQESWSPDVGWFTQSTLGLTPDQVPGLRMALGATGAAPPARPNRFAASTRVSDDVPHVLRIGA